MKTILLLTLSNSFMTYAWYAHLRHTDRPLHWAILTSWGVAFFEYCLAVPANRIGITHFSLTQLKVMQEIITLCVFFIFATVVMKESFRLNYVYAFGCLLGAVYFAFKR